MQINVSEPDDYRLTSTGCGFSLIKKSRAITNPTRHFHPWWEILYIESGERTFFYANRTLHIPAGTFLCIAPGILHRSVNPEGEVCKLYNVYFADSNIPLDEKSAQFSQIAPILQKMNPCVSLAPDVQKEVTSTFSKIGREILFGEDGWKNMAWAYLSQIIVTVSRQKTRAGMAVQNAKEMGYIADVIDFLNMNYSSEINLSSVAKRFGISPGHLSRTFKKATHFGFVEYVNSLRITKACGLLSEKELSVLEISMQCGFGSVTQFGRCFRALTGTTPLAYRAGKRHNL